MHYLDYKQKYLHIICVWTNIQLNIAESRHTLKENIGQHFEHLSAYCSKHLKLQTLTDTCQKLITHTLEMKKKK